MLSRLRISVLGNVRALGVKKSVHDEVNSESSSSGQVGSEVAHSVLEMG